MLHKNLLETPNNLPMDMKIDERLTSRNVVMSDMFHKRIGTHNVSQGPTRILRYSPQSSPLLYYITVMFIVLQTEVSAFDLLTSGMSM